MTRARLVALWRTMAGVVAVCALAVAVEATVPDGVRVRIALATMVIMGATCVVSWRRRPRPLDVGWHSPRDQRDQRDLDAIESGDPIDTATRRDFALNRARQGVYSTLVLVPVLAMQAVLWGAYSWSPLWLRVGVLPLLIIGGFYALHRSAVRIRAINRYEDTVPPGALAGGAQ